MSCAAADPRGEERALPIIGNRPSAILRLYSPAQVGVATLLGWPIAGSILLSANYQKLRHGEAAGMAFFIGMLGTAVLMSLAFVLPWNAGSLAGLVAVPPAVMCLVARLLPGGTAAPSAPLRAGPSGDPQARAPVPHAPGSWRRAVGIGLVCGAGTVGLLVAFPPRESYADLPAVSLGVGEEVEYGPGTSEADAVALGRFLKEVGYFDGQEAKTVRLVRKGEAWIVSFALKEGLWRNPNYLRVFERMREEMAERVFAGRPVELRLCNGRMEPKKTLTPG
jgi:hypothetical protein